jgi:hypothetical protein
VASPPSGTQLPCPSQFTPAHGSTNTAEEDGGAAEVAVLDEEALLKEPGPPELEEDDEDDDADDDDDEEDADDEEEEEAAPASGPEVLTGHASSSPAGRTKTMRARISSSSWWMVQGVNEPRVHLPRQGIPGGRPGGGVPVWKACRLHPVDALRAT